MLPHVRLLFNIQAPDIEDCWCQGYQSFLQNNTKSDNPYADSSKESQAWHDGWWNACLGEEPLFPQDLADLGIEKSSIVEQPVAAANIANFADAPRGKAFVWIRRLFELGLALLVAMLCVELIEFAF